jgi:hypothetical protein
MMFRRLNPHDKTVSASEYNRLLDTVESLMKFSAVFPLEMLRDATGFHVRQANAGFYAKILFALAVDSGNTPYQFEEVQRDGHGNLQVPLGARSGGNAYEINGQSVQDQTIVWLRPAQSGEYLFSVGGECDNCVTTPVLTDVVCQMGVGGTAINKTITCISVPRCSSSSSSSG